MAESEQPVWRGRLGLWDTSGIPQGLYQVVLDVEDHTGNVSTASCNVLVISEGLTNGEGKLLGAFSAMPTTLGRGAESVELNFTLLRDAMTEVVLADMGTGKTLARYDIAAAGEPGGRAGPNRWILDGIGVPFRELPPGMIRLLLLATSGKVRDRRRVDITVSEPDIELAGPSQGSRVGSMPSDKAGKPAGNSGAASSGGAVTGDESSHDRSVDKGENPKDFVRDDNPGKHGGQGNGN